MFPVFDVLDCIFVCLHAFVILHCWYKKQRNHKATLQTTTKYYTQSYNKLLANYNKPQTSTKKQRNYKHVSKIWANCNCPFPLLNPMSNFLDMS